MHFLAFAAAGFQKKKKYGKEVIERAREGGRER
jgi:hypothetical protein